MKGRSIAPSEATLIYYDIAVSFGVIQVEVRMVPSHVSVRDKWVSSLPAYTHIHIHTTAISRHARISGFIHFWRLVQGGVVFVGGHSLRNVNSGENGVQ